MLEDAATLTKLLPNSVSAVAVITVVILFLKHGGQLLTGHQAAMLDMAKSFNDQLNATRKTFSFELRRISDIFTERHEAMLTQVHDLGESNRSTALAVDGLRDAIRELKDQQRHQ